MRPRLCAVLAAAALALAGAPAGAATGATEPAPAPAPPPVRELDVDPEGGEVDRLVPRMLDTQRRATVLLELEGEPVAAAQAEARRVGDELAPNRRQQLRERLAARQRALVPSVEAAGATVVSTLTDAYNGMKVRTPVSALEELAALPGVAGIHDVPLVYPTNERSVPFLGVPEQVWQDLGLTGAGVSVGIVDTGIDYTHATFGGPGTRAAYEANDPAVVERGSFPTAKVVGGIDLVGDDYDATSGTLPNPDPDPLDCLGHGTHVAGTAAGFGVTTDGRTYSGPYGPGLYSEPDQLALGPGVAPGARLYAVKVFGCQGATDATIDAVDWAVANDLDVLNLSLGSVFSLSGTADLEAFENAAAAGVVVVASAGNSGPGTYITGFPASARTVLGVAAVDAVPGLPAVELTADGLTLTLQNSNQAELDGPVTGRLVVLEDDPETPGDESLGCAEEDYASVPDGSVVVTRRGVCPRTARAVLGQAAGAAAVVLVNDAPGLPPLEGPIPEVDIPLLGATPEQGEQLRGLAGQEVTLTDGGTIPNPGFRQPAGFTSAGPALAGNLAKPDVAAPGVAISSAAVGTGTGSAVYSGTSMASPHVAGVAALLREARPGAAAEDVQAAVVNTADPDAVEGYAALRVGAGLVDPRGALDTPVVAVGEGGAASLSFGYVEHAEPMTETRTVTLRNSGAADVRFLASADLDTDASGLAQVAVTPSAVTVPAGGTATVEVSVSVVPPGGVPSEEFSSVSGTVLFRPVDPVPGAGDLRVPLLLVPRAVSAVQSAVTDVRPLPVPPLVQLEARNASPVPGAGEVYAWGLQDPADSPVAGTVPDLRAVGVQAFPDAVPLPAEPDARGVGVFAVHVRDRLLTAVLSEFDVLLDVDENGSHDYAVIGVDAGVLSGNLTGQLASFTVDLATSEVVRVLDAGDELGTSTVTLPFLLSDVGLSADAQPDFTFVGAAYSVLGVGFDVASGEGSFDAYRQPVDTGQSFVVPGGGTTAWSSRVRPGQLLVTPVLGWLVVYPQNPTGEAQVQLVELPDLTGAPPPAPPLP